jgi:pimeloyl-ACP methyl ester carboxylesterase
MNLFRRFTLAALVVVAAAPALAGDGKMSAAPAAEQITPHLARELTGTYRFAPDHEVTLAPFDEFGGSLVMIDLKTLEQRILFLQPDSTFTVGTTTLNATPVQARIAFLRDPDGFPGTLNWVPADGSGARQARRVYPTRHEDVTFRNGDVELHGTLSIPVGPGPHPAVVLVHGSGAATRRIGFFTSVYERLGIATLSFDKRGAGESTGNWKSASFTDLAGDVLAGVALLKARQDIDGTRIGLDGSSQGGWVGSIAASMSPDVAWLQVRVGSGVSVVENMLWEDVAAMRDEGLDAAQTAEVVAFDREIYGIAMRGGSRAEGEAAAAKYASRPWFKQLYPEGFNTSEFGFTWLRANGAIESVDYLRKVKVPVNWYFGATDGNVPTARSAPRVVQALIDAGNPDFSITVLPSDHSFLADVPANGDKSQVKRYVPGFLEANAAWLRARGFAAF